MGIPGSGFSLKTVCQEFTTPRFGSPTLGCMLHWASQNTISATQTGCKLSQFANKCQTTLGSTTITPSACIYLNSCFVVDTCITDTGNDMRTTNSTQAQVYISYCITSRCGSGAENFCTSGTTSAQNTSTPTTITDTINVSNPYPGSGNAITKLYACGIGFNGFGEKTNSQTSAEIQWVDVDPGI